MSYYKYAERDADSQINWAEVGKGISDMLAETNRIRQEKKDAIDAATRQFENDLSNAPQGQNQDINNFTNKYAHNMMNQMRIDEQLLKSGQMPLDKYTLRRQNYVDGTNSLFELSKLYQDEFKKKMEGVNSGELQALNVFNMGSVEGYADFNQSEAVIDSLGDGRVNIGLYENKIIDGKTVKVLSKNIAPVNVIRGKILQNVPTFDVEAATTATVKGFGTRKDFLYEAATLSGAGSITELMGPDFLSTKQDPTTQKIVKDWNDAINDQVNSYFDQTPYNLTSVLTQNLGKYGAESFTFDKDEAAKDENKILVKVDPRTNMTTLDEEAPNYEKQKAEAASWVKTNLLSKIDQERNIKTTSQNQLQERRPKTEGEYAREDEEAEAKEFARQLNKLTVGSNADATNSLPYFQSLLEENGGRINRTTQGIEVITKDGEKKFYGFKANGQIQNPLELQRQLVTSLNTRGLNDDMIGKALKGFYNPSQKINQSAQGGGYARNVEKEILAKVDSNVGDADFYGKGSDKTAKKIVTMFAEYNKANPKNQITVEYERGVGDDIYIYQNGRLISTLNSDEDELSKAKGQKSSLMKLIKKLDADSFLGTKKAQSNQPKKTTAAGGKTR